MCRISPDFGEFTEIHQEAKLYEPVLRYLNADFLASRRPRHGVAQICAEITAGLVAGDYGPWSRMDLAAVCIRRHRFAAMPEVSTLSFEVKTNAGAQLSAVHEALAHRRFASASYLVWHRSACVCDDPNYSVLLKSCALHGVGLITMHNPDFMHTYQIRMEAVAAEQSLDQNDEFICSRFTSLSQAVIAESIARLSSPQQ